MAFLTPLIAIAMLAAPQAAKPTLAEKGEAELARRLEGRVAGEPVQCIQPRNIRSSSIIDGTAIIYDAGGTLYVNRPNGASQLRNSDTLVTRTVTSQLCSLEIVRLVDTVARFTRGSVGLNDFIPYTRVRKPAG